MFPLASIWIPHKYHLYVHLASISIHVQLQTLSSPQIRTCFFLSRNPLDSASLHCFFHLRVSLQLFILLCFYFTILGPSYLVHIVYPSSHKPCQSSDAPLRSFINSLNVKLASLQAQPLLKLLPQKKSLPIEDPMLALVLCAMC